jgi:uncharacterized protein YqgC (DUF456 family)
MSVIVKSVEGEEIRLKETEVSYYTSTYYLVWIIILLLAISAIYFIQLANDTKNSNYGLIGGLGILVFVIFGMFHAIFQFGIKWKPAYKISLHYERIVIEKTTKEADQIAICNAVQRLELVAKTIVKNERELKQIAERCK